MTENESRPEMTELQREVLDALRNKQTDKYPLSSWYLGAICALQNEDNPDRLSQAAHSMRELLEKLPRVIHEQTVVRQPNFKEDRRRIYELWCSDKEIYKGKWVFKTVNRRFNKTLQEIDNYLEANQRPDRKEQIRLALAKIDQMAEMFDPVIQKEKSEKIRKIWGDFEKFAHHGFSRDEQLFGKRFAEAEQLIFDLLAPITAEDQQAINELMEVTAPTEAEGCFLQELLKRRGANYVFFFQNAKNAAWIPILKEHGFFSSPPDVVPDEDGNVIIQTWWPIIFLQRVVHSAPKQVVEIILNLPRPRNPRVLYGICVIACDVEDIELSLKLKSRVISYVKSRYGQPRSKVVIDLLNRWGKGSDASMRAALELLNVAVRFRLDPEHYGKTNLFNESEGLDSLTNSKLKPTPRFRDREYQLLLGHGVQPIFDREPFEAACVLIRAMASMIRLSSRDEAHEGLFYEQLGRPQRFNSDCSEMLIRSLISACENLYTNSPGEIDDLDQVLRQQPWKFFRKLRLHLYALNLNDKTLPWIRECILSHDDYAKFAYDFELQVVIRKACEHFGERLLKEEERTRICEAIVSGPPVGDYYSARGLTGNPVDEAEIPQWQRFYQRKKLRPFASLLTGKYLNYYRKLENEFSEDPLTDEDYLDIRERKGGFFSHRSPLLPEDLKNLQNEELLALINAWEGEFRDSDDWLVRIDIKGMAEAFQSILGDAISFDEERLEFWLENSCRIERPIYVNAIIRAFQSHVSEGNFDRLERWFKYCEWVLSRLVSESGDNVLHENSRESPDWMSSRWTVREFIGICLQKDVNVPIRARDSLAKLLGLLCTQPDWRLDCGRPLIPSRDSQFDEAHENTRSRALHDLLEFGQWVRRYDPTDKVPEVFSILEERFMPEAEHPLTMPEYAYLGWLYGSFFNLDRTWAAKHKAGFFPPDSRGDWVESFGSFLRNYQAIGAFFEILEDDYKLALVHLVKLGDRDPNVKDLLDRLGEHLFNYNIWGLCPLTGGESLLEKFYRKTTKDPQRWASLFNYVGRVLKRRKVPLTKEIRDRVVAFFDWRLKAKEEEELREFDFWLSSECLDPDWRLDALSRVLDVTQSKGRGLTIMPNVLEAMLENHKAKVVKCYRKLTETNSEYAYFSKDQAQLILAAGFNSADENVRRDAMRALENLLSKGHYNVSDFDLEG